MLVKLGDWFEIELTRNSVYARMGARALHWSRITGLSTD